MPIEVCTRFGAWMPVADCRLDLCFSVALRRSASTRVAHATSVTTSAPGPLTRSNSVSPAKAASALASTSPDDSPISAKFGTVSGCAHSWMKRRHA